MKRTYATTLFEEARRALLEDSLHREVRELGVPIGRVLPGGPHHFLAPFHFQPPRGCPREGVLPIGPLRRPNGFEDQHGFGVSPRGRTCSGK